MLRLVKGFSGFFFVCFYNNKHLGFDILLDFPKLMKKSFSRYYDKRQGSFERIIFLMIILIF